ncbi:putative alpha/beta hydrolase [Mumia flava]|uniref:Putative alpha/beta hydrolase n=1 Tax=Mumia flava TaxID=1348852 RepID=A0A2M9B643_9ACTN|nr:alpha/beta fold hydrolase [Mumia flava]PJJ53414.1 putative alpha/beta hydrolase [Mumia flava]
MTNAGAPHVVIAPAMGVPSRFYRALEKEIASLGWSACTLAARGIDRDTEPPSRDNDWGYQELVASLDKHVHRFRDAHPGVPVLVLGHSLGGQVAISYLLSGGDLDGVVLAGASVPYYPYYGARAWGIWALAASVPLVTAVRGHWPSKGFAGPQPRTLMRQWARLVRRRRFPHPEGALPRHALDVPAFVLQVEGDTLSVPRACRALARVFEPQAVTDWTYERSAAPDDVTIDHIAWAKAPGPALAQVRDWWERAGAAEPQSSPGIGADGSYGTRV